MASEMERKLVENLETFTSEIGNDIAETFHGAILDRVEDAEQGADGLMDYVREVEEHGDSYTIEIAHPTAPLHEVGGHIEPTYGQSMVVGWDRDGFYEALTDCNEWVEPKHLVRDAAAQTRREYQ